MADSHLAGIKLNIRTRGVLPNARATINRVFPLNQALVVGVVATGCVVKESVPVIDSENLKK